MKRIFVIVVRGIAGIAGLVFLFCPLSTWTMVLAFGGSIAVFLICQIVLSSLDETFLDDEGAPTGYWPPKPIDWTVPTENRDPNNSETDGRGR
jgi:hypothetical protein